MQHNFQTDLTHLMGTFFCASQEAMGDQSKIKVSLRSIGDEDTTVISQAFGGGGHRNASSFITDIAHFKAWLV